MRTRHFWNIVMRFHQPQTALTDRSIYWIHIWKISMRWFCIDMSIFVLFMYVEEKKHKQNDRLTHNADRFQMVCYYHHLYCIVLLYYIPHTIWWSLDGRIERIKSGNCKKEQKRLAMILVFSLLLFLRKSLRSVFFSPYLCMFVSKWAVDCVYFFEEVHQLMQI